MANPLPLWPGAMTCIQCGYCCRVGICSFGEWDQKKNQCSYLTDDLRCQRYEFILESHLQEFSPAFGAGCCSAFNGDRRKKLNEKNIGMDQIRRS